MLEKFQNLNISEVIIRALNEMGFEEPTPIQAESIPVAMSGSDMIGQAQTGTGKTAAYGIPVLEKILKAEPSKDIQTVVLSPTRELAMQVAEELNHLAQFTNIQALPIYGGQDMERQLRRLRKCPQIIVATPGRLIDHMKRGTIDLSHITTIVLDEADEMLDMGFIDDINLIMAATPNTRQTLLFSATMPKPIQQLAETFLHDPLIIRMKAKEVTMDLIEQSYIEVPDRQKFDILCRLLDLQEPDLAIIFVRTKRRVDEVSEALKKRGYSAEGIHGDLTQAKRDTVTGALMYRKNGNWTTVDFEAKGTVTPHQGTLVLTYQPAAHLDNPLYYNHFSLSRLENGTATLLNYDEGGDGGQTSWMNTFKDGCPLEAGTYLLTTGTRLANGSVLSHSEFFVIKEGQTTTVPLIMRESKDEVQVIGSFNSESKFDMDGNQVSLLSQTGRGYYIIGLIGVGQEPTNHALVDIAKEADAFDRWGRPMVLLFENAEEAKKFDASLYGRLPKNIIYGIDTDGAIRQQMVENLKLSSKTQLPIFFIADTFNRVVFSSQGYTIGLGEQLKNTFNRL